MTAECKNQSQPTRSAPEDRECRQAVQLQLDEARHTTVTPGLRRKRANSLDASSSRISGVKRMRPLDAVTQQLRIELPKFAAEATAREIIVVSDDDLDADDGGTWFDYLGPTVR